MRIHLLIPEVRELLQEDRREDLLSVLQEMHPSDAAAIVGALTTDEIATALSMLPLELERDLFGYLDPDVQEQYVAGAGRARVENVLQAMLSDDRAEFLDRLDARIRDQLIPMLPKAAREDLMRRAKFADDQVGAFLTTDYAVLNPLLTARGAIAELRRQAPSKETIYYSYVVDRFGRLVGFVSLRDLILAPETKPVGEIMKTDLVSVTAEADQEEAARIIRDYDLLALPVVDEDNRLIGIVTHDDAVDIVEEEAQEDFEKMAGVMVGPAEPGEYDYFDEPVWRQVRRRAPVICVLAIFWILTAAVIQNFEDELHRAGVLVLALLPMVMATGGMVGTQASALVIRALMVQGSERGPLARVVWKELRVAGLMALALAAIAFVNAMLVSRTEQQPEPLELVAKAGAVIGLAMLCHVLSAALLGALTPLIVKKLRGDPAMISTPAVTAIADLTGAVIYLLLVTLLIV